MAHRLPNPLDLVAVTRVSQAAEYGIGDVGAIVELLPPDAVEVEFVDNSGRTRAIATLKLDDVLLLNWTRTRVA